MGKEWNILAVGNSFSEDAFYYLHQIAEADGVSLTAVNLYIGGCPLQRHWENIRKEAPDYRLEINGQPTGRYVSSNEMLKDRKWDVIMTQQASHDSGIWETYVPYVKLVTDYFHEVCPDARRVLHKTWAYEKDSTHDAFGRYHHSQSEMYEKLSECYARAAKETGLALIPTGDVIQKVRSLAPFRYELGERSLCRDGFHMDMIYGRYLAAAAVYSFLTGADIRKNTFVPQGAEEQAMQVIRTAVWETTASCSDMED